MHDVSRPPTAHDVARQAGVSQAAVSRTFTPGASISAKTRAKVLAAAEALGYRPNLLARSLITGRSTLVGVGVGNLENDFFRVALEALTVRLAQEGHRILLFRSAGRSEAADVDPHVDELLHYKIDALILLAATLSSDLAEQCRKAEIPVIYFNRTGKALEAICSVTGENERGAAEIAQLFLDIGYARPAYLAGLELSSTSIEREAGFMERMTAAGRAVLREIGHFDRAEAIAATRRLLARQDRPDAIFCANDHMAFAAIDVARADFGLAVGRDIAIVGFDDVPMAAWPSFSLTSFAQPIGPMVEQAIAFALRRGKLRHRPVRRPDRDAGHRRRDRLRRRTGRDRPAGSGRLWRTGQYPCAPLWSSRRALCRHGHALNWTSPDKRFDVNMFVRNLTNRYVYINAQDSTSFTVVPGAPYTAAVFCLRNSARSSGPKPLRQMTSP